MPGRVPGDVLDIRVVASKLICAALISLYVVILAYSWDLEEPAKANTIICFAAVTVTGISLIFFARSLRAIRSPGCWIFALLVKLLVALLIVKYSWMTPLSNLQRADGDADQLSYDLHGQALAEAGLASSAIENVVRGDTKAMFWYVGLIYYCFGVSTLYVSLVNCLFSLATFLALSGILTHFDPRTNWNALSWGMFWPEIAFYDATPAKDPITMGTSYIVLYCFFALAYMRRWRFFLIGVALVSITTLGWVRPLSVITTSLVLLLFWIVDSHPGRKTVAIAGVSLLAVLVCLQLTGTLSLEKRMAGADETLTHNESPDPARRGVLDMLNAHGPLDLLIKTPVRALIFVFGPYPKVLPDLERLKSIKSDVAVGIQEVYQKASVIALIAVAPMTLTFLFSQGTRRTSLVRFLNVLLIITMLAGTTASILIHLRYRIQVDPGLYAASVAAYKYDVVVKTKYLWYGMFALGSICYYIMQLLAL